jgi:chorismate mutase
MELNEIRKAIDETDSKLIGDLVKRFNLVREVAEYKKANNMPIRDVEREKILLGKWKQKFKKEGFDDDKFVEKLFELVLNEAIKLERKNGAKD